MAETTEPTILEKGQDFIKRATSTIPPGKSTVLVVGAEWKGWTPVVSVGLATRVGDSFSLGANAERRFQRHGSSGSIWAAASW